MNSQTPLAYDSYRRFTITLMSSISYFLRTLRYSRMARAINLINDR